MESTSTEESGWNCSIHPSVFFLLGTLVLTTCATGMLCGSIMTDHWEEITWDRLALETIANGTIRLQWLLDGLVARASNNNDRVPSTVFFVPMHGGIWTLCVSLSEEEMVMLTRVGFPQMDACVNYLAGGLDRGEEQKVDWQHPKSKIKRKPRKKKKEISKMQQRYKSMQNLSISCALVCLIILGSAALVGAFGVCKHQISAVLITGVMYLLAASFALFTLTIIHFKRMQGRSKITVDCDGTIDGVVTLPGTRGLMGLGPPKDLLTARVFTTSWSLDLGWGGVMLCVMTSILWILLSKIMRFNPISSIIG